MFVSKVSSLDTDVEKCGNTVHIYDVFKPFLTILNIAGLHMPIERGRMSNAMSIIYSVFIHIVLWSTLCRFFIRYTNEVYTVESWMAVLSYAGVQSIGMYFGSATCFGVHKHLHKFFRQYDSYRDTHASTMDSPALRRNTRLFLFPAAFVVIICVPILYFMLLHNVDPAVMYLKPMKLLPREYFPVVKAIFFIAYYLIVIQAVFTLAFFCVLTYCLFKEFKQLNAELTSLFGSKEGDAQKSYLERIRRQFEDTCSLVCTVDKVFRHMIGSGYIASVPIICLMLYGLIKDELMKKEYTMLLTCILFFVILVVTTLLASVALNIKAHSSLMYLLMADFAELSATSLNIVNIFITRLTTTKIGYTVYNLFTIDCSTILMLTGTMLTYVVVILQFKPD
ncbi:uncharacterized protein LOC125377548 [Haliotis rufescens]|uniref:uncharacterized protein LOC125377548 n=1 Tax=Haliotis rufescens TaxID=6454 RepID=UPI00201F4CB8|nr:uncharacterized protein LOC125377548 [Haliotis rufescens]